MKKTIAITLCIIILVLSLSACADTKKDGILVDTVIFTNGSAMDDVYLSVIDEMTVKITIDSGSYMNYPKDQIEKFYIGGRSFTCDDLIA